MQGGHSEVSCLLPHPLTLRPPLHVPSTLLRTSGGEGDSGGEVCEEYIADGFKLSHPLYNLPLIMVEMFQLSKL